MYITTSIVIVVIIENVIFSIMIIIIIRIRIGITISINIVVIICSIIALTPSYCFSNCCKSLVLITSTIRSAIFLCWNEFVGAGQT